MVIIWLMIYWIIWFINDLVGRIPTPLKNMSESQLGWWHSHIYIYIWRDKSHVPNHQPFVCSKDTTAYYCILLHTTTPLRTRDWFRLIPYSLCGITSSLRSLQAENLQRTIWSYPISSVPNCSCCGNGIPCRWPVCENVTRQWTNRPVGQHCFAVLRLP